jgi:hypothetical protein
MCKRFLGNLNLNFVESSYLADNLTLHLSTCRLEIEDPPTILLYQVEFWLLCENIYIKQRSYSLQITVGKFFHKLSLLVFQ